MRVTRTAECVFKQLGQLVAVQCLALGLHSAAERGQAQGLMELGNGTVAALASFASGALLSGLGWSPLNLAALGLLALALLLVAGGPRQATTA